MTRDEAVKKHRAMWRWIAEQIESQKKRLCIPRLKDIYCQVNRDKSDNDEVDIEYIHKVMSNVLNIEYVQTVSERRY